MSRELIDDWTWALQFTGDPQSWQVRGEMLRDFLKEEGLKPSDHVLDIGAGCLSPGKALIEYLDPDRYTGIEPFGLLVNIAMRRFPHLESKVPNYLWNTDFDASEAGVAYPFAVAHSVLSHVAHWQMEAALTKVRAVMPDGGIWLASVILSEENSFDSAWVYPSVSRFRLQTIQAIGHHVGWRVERCGEYENRLQAACPNDTHQILRFTAFPSASEMNDLRLTEEALAEVERETREIAETLYVERMKALDDDWVARLRS